MATRIWRGDAVVVQQVTTFTPTPANNTAFAITINGKSVTYTSDANGSAQEIVEGLAAAIAAAEIAEFDELTWTENDSVLTATGADTGAPFTATSTGAGTLAVSTTTTAKSPNHWIAENFSGATLPVSTDDVIIQDSSVSILYGLDQSSVTLNSLTIAADYTGLIGLPIVHPAANGLDAYYEYRETTLKISADIVTIGDGRGTGSGRIKLALGSNEADVTIFTTGQASDTDYGAVMLTNAHADSSLAVFGGSVDVAMLPGQTSTIPSIVTSGNAQVRLGTGVTLTTVEANGQSQVEVRSAATTLKTQDGGRITKLAAGTVGSVLVYGGQVEWQGGGTITALTVGAGKTFDASGCLIGFTVTDSTAYDQATINDAGGKATFTNATSCPDGAQSVRFISKKGATVKVA